jgi:DNA-binding transcriptional MerR regulator
MQIGELAAATGVPARRIRFYEEKGILPEPDRTPAGYREYDVGAAHRIRFLISAQHAGLTLAEIRGVMAIRDNGEAPCAHTRSLLESKRLEVTDRLRHLEVLRTELDRLIDAGQDMGPESCLPDDVCSIISGSRQGQH